MNTRMLSLRRKPLAALTVTAAALATFSTSASAGFDSSGGGDYNVVPLYRAFLFGGIDREGDGGFLWDDFHGIDYVSNIAPMTNAVSTATIGVDGTTYRGVGQATWSGFYASRNYAQMSITNAKSESGYYLVAGQGSASTVRFYTADAQAAMATFTWHVSGTTSNPAGIGQATGRLDFGATTDTGVNWNALFDDPGDTLNSITEFGPGTYTYTMPIADLGTAINMYFWSSAFAEVKTGQSATGSNFTMTADYSSTYLLESVGLTDAQGNAITHWTLEDLNLGKVVFDQNGRIDPIDALPAIPEPGTYALMAGGLALVGWTARRRRTPQPI